MKKLEKIKKIKMENPKKEKIELSEHVERYLESAKTLMSASDKASDLFEKATGMPAPNRPTAFLAPDVVLKIITGDKKSNIIIEKGSKAFHLFTSDFALYEAIGSVSKDELNLYIFVNFLNMVSIIPSTKIKLSMDRVDYLRNVMKK